MTIKKSHLKKLIIAASLGIALWGVVAWLFVTVPLLVVNALPSLLPLAVFAFLLFLAGLLLLASVASSIVRIIAPRYTWLVILMASILIVLYNLSPLAPAWKCFGKRLYAATANAAGQNCTTVCTNNKKKPCGGWSSCWDKDISCSASGIDQDGRPCQGCCFSCDVVCDPEPDPDQPPTITGSVSCSQNGNNGWCVGTSTLNLTASDPQGNTLTISGSIGGSPFTCPQGNTCSRTLPNGNGAINYTVTASQSGMSDNGSTTWKRDTTSPTVTPNVPSVTGSNGWFNTIPVAISVTGSDALSGLSSAQVSINGGTWQSNASLSSDGAYTVAFRAVDNAGNIATTTKPINIDKTSPTIVAWAYSGQVGANGWYISEADVTADAVDATSGIDTLLLSDNGGVGQVLPVMLGDGVHNLIITATDKAGNSKSVSVTLNIDSKGPTISPTVSAIGGTNGWYVSEADVNATASDNVSGMQGTVEISQDNGSSWSALPVHLTEGMHAVKFRASDNAGNLSTSSLNVNVDTTPPTFTASTIGAKGNAGWYVSNTTTTVSPDDALSGVDHVEYDQNSAGWQTGTSIDSADGQNKISLHVYDAAGNQAVGSVSINVDIVPPELTPSISGTVGKNGWLVSNSSASAKVSDATSGTNGAAEISLDGGTTWQNAPVALSDGVYSMIVRAFDMAGNKETASLNASIDTAKPGLSFVYNGTLGSNGWYVSKVEVSPKAYDALSGLDTSAVRAEGGAWSPVMTLSDGKYTIDAQADDLAGNTNFITDTLRIDTEVPISVFDNTHKANEVISAVVSLGGESSDEGSGVQTTEVSTDGGVTWHATALSGDTWSYAWNTTMIPNGIYTVLVRSMDSAGNLEKPTSSLTLIVDNIPPSVKITDWWWIWQSGEYKVSENSFAISEIKVTISDPENRWSPRVITYKPSEMFAAVTWDRRFPEGIVAPWGNYNATVLACDIYGNCASDKGQIKIPILASVPVSATPSPTAMPTITPTITASPIPATPMPTQTQVQIISTVEVKRPQPNKYGIAHKSMWVIIVLSLLVLLFGTEALFDPRPKALRSLAKTISTLTSVFDQFMKE